MIIGGVLLAGLLVVALTTREIPIVRFLASDPRDPQFNLACSRKTVPSDMRV